MILIVKFIIHKCMFVSFYNIPYKMIISLEPCKRIKNSIDIKINCLFIITNVKIKNVDIGIE